MIGVPYCTEPYSEIVPGLYIGGHDYQPDGTPWRLDAIVGAEFDLVISMYERPGHGPADGVTHLYLRIPDGNLTAEQLADLRTLADWAAEAVHNGSKCLNRCQAGLNRSSLVAAFTMLRLGYDAAEAIATIRARRSPNALFNTHFQRYIADEAARLGALKPAN